MSLYSDICYLKVGQLYISSMSKIYNMRSSENWSKRTYSEKLNRTWSIQQRFTCFVVKRSAIEWQQSSRLDKFMMMTIMKKLLTTAINTIRYFMSRENGCDNCNLETNGPKYPVFHYDACKILILIGCFALMIENLCSYVCFWQQLSKLYVIEGKNYICYPMKDHTQFG